MEITAWIGLLSAGVVLFSGLFGAWLGAKIQNKGAMDAIGKQIEKDEEKRAKDKREQDTFIGQVITNYLLSEIEWNYNMLDIWGSKDLPIGHKVELGYTEFEQAKYLILKNPNDQVRQIIKLYGLFKDIQAANPDRRDPGRLKILSQIIEQKKIIEDLTKIM